MKKVVAAADGDNGDNVAHVNKSTSIPFLVLLVTFNLITTALYQIVYKMCQNTFGDKHAEFLNDMR